MATGGNPVLNGKNFRSQTGSGGVATAEYDQMTNPRQFDEVPGPVGTHRPGRMTYDDVIIKTLACLAMVIAGAAIPVLVLPGFAGILMVIGALGGFALGLVNSIKREPVPGLILAYAVLEGLFLGALTKNLDTAYPGVGLQAVIGTLAVFAVTLALFKSGKVRATPKAVRFFMIAIIGYGVFSLLNMGLMIFGVVDDPWGVRGMEIAGIPLGVIIGLLAVGLAAFSLIMDFTEVEHGVRAGAPERYSWSAAFGLTVTLVWLYVEILRILSILREE